MKLETTIILNFGRVILTEGMVDATTGERFYSAFLSEADARSEDADSLAVATVSDDMITPEQIRMAVRNSERLSG